VRLRNYKMRYPSQKATGLHPVVSFINAEQGNDPRDHIRRLSATRLRHERHLPSGKQISSLGTASLAMAIRDAPLWLSLYSALIAPG
jgi:hypothetical protein